MSQINLDALRRYGEPITDELKKLLTVVRSEFPEDISPQGVWVLQELTDYACRAGKRLRGSLAAYTYDTLTGKDMSEQALQLGAALELMQDYLLIIDDVMDRSPLRRGKPTVHVQYASANPNASDHEANMVAINVGLLAQHIAAITIARIEEDPQNVRLATEAIHRNIAITGFGQIDDLYEQVGRSVTRKDIERKHLLKTAYYTFINPLQAGLALAGIEDVHGDVLQYGAPAGTAFQVHDDYLGIFGDDTEMGKANLDDIREGKYTYMVQYALEHASGTEVDSLKQILCNVKADDADLAAVRDILVRTGALDANKQIESAEASKAKQAVLESKLWPKSFADNLVALVDYSIERTK